MELPNTHIPLSNSEERPLPLIPRSELVCPNTLESPSVERTEPPSQQRIPVRDDSTSTSVENNARTGFADGESTSTQGMRFSIMPVPTQTSSLSLGTALVDRSSGASNSMLTDDRYSSGNFNIFPQVGDNQSGGSGGFLSHSNTHSYDQSPLNGVSFMLQSNLSGNAPSSSRLLPPLPPLSASSNNSEVVEMRVSAPPRWQLDSEVHFCPICQSRFSFFVRKHHCRKCGRVVCNSCSPHRITIPYQYIVQPPSQEDASTLQVQRIQHTDTENSSEDIGGGQQVRLCNPCVPDPNTAPPRILAGQNDQRGYNYYSSLNQSALARTLESPLLMASYLSREFTDSGMSNPSVHSRQYNSTAIRPQASRQSDMPHRSSHNRRRERGFGAGSLGNRPRSSTTGPPSYSNHFAGSSSLPSDTPLLQSSCSMLATSRHEQSLPHSQSSSRPQISEEDECWICHIELPPKSLDNFEELRTSHVNECIRLAIQLASGSRRDDIFLPPEERNLIEHGPENVTSNSEDLIALRDSPQNQSLATGPNSNRGRRTGVFTYKATEKDCLDDAECAICLEEFEVGIEMGRLECFCRFHLKCIRGWFKTRPGQCPVHQHGAGY